ncbi:cell filamentation protein Fic [Alkalispirochaeta sphaeroplastigenens]|uniref:Cell filamentation protein Fic n=1 Tax=Alkalispirochaeta sphaeroplastigenens TaxID=1187066 RepID=A0A2S4JGL8_9SPIO|nr:Fic family protein [Alkalispirochaeta sphaeroplastigenens]POQ98615.1 cell filamentation protein Fic [Alkalispirochaeta sphaeroplastigenens]
MIVSNDAIMVPMKPPYEITNRILLLYGQITESLGLCKSLLLVKPEARLRRQNRIKTIHSSLAIEGNTLDIEHVTALIENERVVGPRKDIVEVQNAIRAYEHLSELDPYSLNDFLKAHRLLLEGLIESAGQFRKRQVGIIKGAEVQHVAPGYSMVPGLMKDLFDYIKRDSDIDIIKSCVFHYEMEFIHPFEDGNGRMGRYWQTRLLMNVNPIFEYVPIEETIKNNQEQYYKTLAEADNTGKSTGFIEFMLDAINLTLRETIDESNPGNIDFKKRSDFALSLLNEWFDRKDYMKINKGISGATASRDLKQLVEGGRLETSGEGRMTRYKRIG